MRGRTVSEVAKLSGVSARMLRHYDEVGLLKPAAVGANGYRYYGQEELLRLQQILLHRELGFGLEEIRQVLEAEGFDRIAALKGQREKLLAQSDRYRELARTIDETLAALEGDEAMDEEGMYRGFDLEKTEEARAEDWLRQRFGPKVQAKIDRSRAVGAAWSPEETEAYHQEGLAFDGGVAKALKQGLSATSEVVQALVRDHCATVCRGWGVPATKTPCLTLAEVYRDMPQFRQRFEAIGPGAGAFIAEAITAYAERELS